MPIYWGTFGALLFPSLFGHHWPFFIKCRVTPRFRCGHFVLLQNIFFWENEDTSWKIRFISCRGTVVQVLGLSTVKTFPYIREELERWSLQRTLVSVVSSHMALGCLGVSFFKLNIPSYLSVSLVGSLQSLLVHCVCWQELRL